MIPSCSHTGTPRHFQVSTTSGSASLTRARSLASVSPRQSPNSSIRLSISFDGDLLPEAGSAFLAGRFLAASIFMRTLLQFHYVMAGLDPGDIGMAGKVDTFCHHGSVHNRLEEVPRIRKPA